MNFAAFDLNLLRVFDALMRERSATRAGEQIGLSQPAVSAALHRLRGLLGDRLFVRQGNDMLPTPRAESLAAGVREALTSLEILLSEERVFDPGAQSRNFTLMGADLFSTQIIPELAERFSAASYKISLRFLDSARGDVERLLKEDAIDAALERPLDMPDWIATELLFVSLFKIIISKARPAVKNLDVTKPLPLDVMCNIPWAIRSIDGGMAGAIDDELAKLGKKRRTMLAVPHFHAVTRCVAKGQLAAAVPAQFARSIAKEDGLMTFDLPFESPKPEIRLYWHNRHTKNPAHRWLRQQIKESCQHLVIP